MKHWRLLFILCFPLLPVHGQGSQTTTPEDEAIHQSIRNLRDAMVNALNKGDLDALLPYVHQNIVFTPMNGEVCRGPEALRAYFNRMMKEPGHIVESMHTNPTVDRLTDLYGGTAGVAYGSSLDHYKLTDGQEFDVKARWTATLVKDNDTWKLASFQSAANVFDNPLLDKAKSTLYWSAGAAGALGIALGMLFGRRRKAAAA